MRNLEDLNAQLTHWLDTIANPRVHATTRRVVNETFAEEPLLPATLPLAPYRTVLKPERRITRDGMVSVGGNLYSVPDSTRRRTVEVQCLAEEILILEEGRLVAVHPVLEGRNRRRVAAGHRRPYRSGRHRSALDDQTILLERAGDRVARRPLDIYEAVAHGLASRGARP